VLFFDQDVTGDRVLDVLDRLFHGLSLADAAGQTDGFGHVTFIFFIAIKDHPVFFHHLASPASMVVQNPTYGNLEFLFRKQGSVSDYWLLGNTIILSNMQSDCIMDDAG
jgi:hypothetical protein